MSAEQLVGGRYALRSQLGRGAFGTVWRATDTVLGRDVAVKHIAFDRFVTEAERAEAIKRFRREAQVLAALNHPNIVTAHDYGVADDEPYLVMELIRGHSLATEQRADPADQRRPLPLDRVLGVAMEVCAGLSAAHETGLVHRDLKPANVMVVARTGRVKIVDFGIARLTNSSSITRPGRALGTLPYLAPEQFGDAALDGRADLYSLACMVHELLTGTFPYAASTEEQWVAAHLFAKPTPLRGHLDSAPAALETLLLEMLAKKPDKRPASAAVLQQRLADIRAANGVSFGAGRARVGAQPPDEPTRPAETAGPEPPRSTIMDSQRRRAPRIALLAGLLAVSLAATAVLLAARPWQSGGVGTATAPEGASATPTTSARQTDRPAATASPTPVTLTGGGATITVTGHVEEGACGMLVLVTDDGARLRFRVAPDVDVDPAAVRVGARATVTGQDLPNTRPTDDDGGGGVRFPWLCSDDGAYLSVHQARPA